MECFWMGVFIMGITDCRLKLINSCIHPLTWHSFIFHAEIAWSSSLPLLEDEEQKAARTACVAVLWHTDHRPPLPSIPRPVTIWWLTLAVVTGDLSTQARELGLTLTERDGRAVTKRALPLLFSALYAMSSVFPQPVADGDSHHLSRVPLDRL